MRCVAVRIDHLIFNNFRNLKNGSIYPDENVNIFYGQNAHGKTNILEAIWLFTGGRSFRGSRDKNLITFGNLKSEIKMNFFSKERDQSAVIIIEKNKRSAILNDVEKKSATDLIGSFCAVVFSPTHLSLIKDGPTGRRRFVDAALCQIKPSYASLLIRYNHTLLQRNTLVKDIKYHHELIDTLDIWNSNLARYGSLIIKNRINYIEKIKDISKEIYFGISSGKENLDIEYKTCYDDKLSVNDIELILIEEYKKSLDDDIKCGFTNIGPHRDDIDIYVNKKLARSYASQGQQRSCVLSLKLAESEILKLSIGEKPVILLDDVMSELDNKRKDYILNSIKDFQVFITCCEPSDVLKLSKGKKFEVIDGRVK